MPEKRPPNAEDVGRGCNPLLVVILLVLVALIGYVVWINNPVEAPDPTKTGPATGAPGRQGS